MLLELIGDRSQLTSFQPLELGGTERIIGQDVIL